MSLIGFMKQLGEDGDDDDDCVEGDDDNEGLPMVGDLLVVASGHRETLPLS